MNNYWIKFNSNPKNIFGSDQQLVSTTISDTYKSG
jgi:hypothetical protein